MIARQDTETTGIIRDRFVKAKFGGKISDRLFDGAGGSNFSVSVFATQIFLECLEDLL